MSSKTGMSKGASAVGKKPKVVVIGAGVGGASTAARLAHAGFEVEVFEKNAFSGGRCSLIHHEGYRFDQGPSLLLLPPIFYSFYRDLETRLEDHLELIKCDPNYILHFHDGEKIQLSTDRAKLRQVVEKYEGPGGGERLEGFLQESGRHAQLSYNLVLSKTFPTILSMLSPAFVANVFALHPFSSMWDRCCKYFRTESLLQWSETVEGIWYPKGGFNKVVQSFIELAENHGAKFHYSSAVSHVSINPSTNEADGVVLSDGSKIDADIVVVNADLAYAHSNLFRDQNEQPGSKRDPRLAKKLTGKPHSCSSISFYWAMDRKVPDLNAHNIFLAEEYKDSFDDIFKRSSIPKEPSFYVNVPSRLDTTAAPEGKDALVVLVPVGHMILERGGEHQDWDGMVKRARGQILEVLEQRLGISDFEKHIVWEDVNTPLTWKDKFNLTHGSILGISHDFFNVLWFRQQARHPTVGKTYFVGASVHPGTGVPIALAGSRLVTETILDDLHRPLPPSYEQGPLQPKSSLDVIRPPSVIHQLESWIPTLVSLFLGAILTLLWFHLRF